MATSDGPLLKKNTSNVTPGVQNLWAYASLLYNHIFTVLTQFLYGDWDGALSSAINGLVAALALPIEMVGNFLDNFLNDTLGGQYTTVDGKKLDLSILGHLDRRVTLQKTTHKYFPVPRSTAKANADVCAMATKLAYENAAVVRDVVENRWNKGHAEEARFEYADYLKQEPARNNQNPALFARSRRDKSGVGLADTNAHVIVRRHAPAVAASRGPTAAVVVAFRGTEPFSPRDWSTDFDFEAVEMSSIGRVHKGFLEGLGIGPRQMADFNSYILAAVNDDNAEPPLPQPPLATTAIAETAATAPGAVAEGADHPQQLLPPPAPRPSARSVTRAELQQRFLHFYANGELDEKATPLYFVLRERVLALLTRGARLRRAEADMTSGVENTDVHLFITGHSLGGALAALFTSLLVVDSGIARNRLKALYTFGQPRVGDLSFTWQLNNRLNTRELRFIRLLHCNDVVPRVPFDNALFQYKHVGPWFHSSPTNRIQMGGFNDQPAMVMAPLVLLVATVRQLFVAIWRWLSSDEDITENSLSLLTRFAAFGCPWLVDHSTVNYVNAVRLGLPDDDFFIE